MAVKHFCLFVKNGCMTLFWIECMIVMEFFVVRIYWELNWASQLGHDAFGLMLLVDALFAVFGMAEEHGVELWHKRWQILTWDSRSMEGMLWLMMSWVVTMTMKRMTRRSNRKRGRKERLCWLKKYLNQAFKNNRCFLINTQRRDSEDKELLISLLTNVAF